MPNIANPNDSPPVAPGEPNLQPGIIATTITVTVLADIVVCLRLITRKWVVKSIGWDDWTIIGAALGITIGCALVLVEVHYGFGRHKYDLSHDSYVEFTRYSYGEWIQTFQTLMFTKISICLFFLRIVINRAFVWSLWSVIGVLVVSNVALTIAWIVQCRPVYLAWISPNQPGSCFTELQLQQIVLAQAVIAIASDFVLASYPIFILRKIQMALRVKVGLCILMGLGVITGSFCIVRTIGNWQNVNNDSTCKWTSVPNWYWRSWEVCVGIIAASIPTLRPGYKTLRGHMSSYIKSRSTKTTSKISEKPPRPSDPASSTTRPSGRAEVTRNALPVLPANALRPDRNMATVEVGIGHNSLHLPLQDTSGIMKTTQIDLESRRETMAGEASSIKFAEEGTAAERVSSRTALKGEGELM